MAASNPATRVLQVLEYLASKPSEAYGLSELARRIGISKSTCLSILNTLTEAGYVIQHPQQKHYYLGPSVVALGQAALTRLPDVEDVTPALKRLSRETGMAATAEALAADQIVVVASVGQQDPMRGFGRVGVRLPFAPPYGAPLAAALDADGLSAYLGRARPALAKEERQRLLNSFSVARRRGYFVTLEPPEGALHERLEEARQARAPAQHMGELGAARREAGYFLDEIKDRSTYNVSSIAAPIISRTKNVEVALALLAFGWRAKGEEIKCVGQMLVEAASAARDQVR